ncbi:MULTISPECIES: hypothetical protein [Flavobacterium]|uniref:hypothetical protein n=1 Tax=Flavobacterium TaxID=237 RepID=UPI00096A0610|nr:MULTISPECIES: hypothetical protein [Flavobacterium]MBN9284893.1 hypothetical protein [Flavobacterium sp.]OJV72206.1 MAG: hypothetical protein BGO42_03195 [Flavobacterium sp. 40-81]
MRKVLIITCSLFISSLYAQEHFSGINTTRRTGILNASVNPAELSNLSNRYEVNIFNTSLNVSNNKISFKDIVKGNNVEDLIFEGDKPVNMRLDAEILGPSFAMKKDKWTFAVTSSAKVKANLIDVDVNLGNALRNSFIGSAMIASANNQRVNAVTWGEIGFSASRIVFEDDVHKFSGGATFKLLFPGSYANISADKFTGTVTNVLGDVELTNAHAALNVAYSGSLADGFTDSSNFNQFFGNGINGYAVDLGVNYQWKDTSDDSYKINAGLSVRNLGSMTFKADNNVSRDYSLSVQGLQSFDLNQFEGVDNIKEIEQILLNSGYATVVDTKKDFKVKTPTVLSAYADVRLHEKWYATVYTQQKIVNDSENNLATAQNIITITPRFSAETYEIYSPWSSNEISGLTGGIGFRYQGFFIGSGSIITALVNDTKQADAYLGFRIGF